MSRISLELVPGREQSSSWGRKDEEYMADFILVSRRTLSDFDYQVFNYHFLLGADWRLCCRRMSIDRGAFFHVVYRIQQELGRVFRELEPYGLYPTSEYFHGAARAVTPKPPERVPLSRLRPPLANRGIHPGLRKTA